MTKVEFFKSGERFSGIKCEGHTGYAESGEDIVCAALSSIIQTAALGIFQVAKADAEFKMDDESGFLEVMVPDTASDNEKHDSAVILKTAYLGASDLYEQFSDFIKLEVKDL